MAEYSQHTSAEQTPIPCVTWIKTKREGGVKSVYSCAFKPERLDLSCKANKCRDAGTVDLGELTTHETLPCFDLGDAGSNVK